MSLNLSAGIHHVIEAVVARRQPGDPDDRSEGQDGWVGGDDSFGDISTGSGDRSLTIRRGDEDASLPRRRRSDGTGL